MEKLNALVVYFEKINLFQIFWRLSLLAYGWDFATVDFIVQNNFTNVFMFKALFTSVIRM